MSWRLYVRVQARNAAAASRPSPSATTASMPSIAPVMAKTAANARQICAKSSPPETLSKRRVATRFAASTRAATVTRAQAAPTVPACGTLQRRSGIEHDDSKRGQRRVDPRSAKRDENRPRVCGTHVDGPRYAQNLEQRYGVQPLLAQQEPYQRVRRQTNSDRNRHGDHDDDTERGGEARPQTFRIGGKLRIARQDRRADGRDHLRGGQARYLVRKPEQPQGLRTRESPDHESVGPVVRKVQNVVHEQPFGEAHQFPPDGQRKARAVTHII